MERERTRRQGATTQAALQALSMLPTAAATLGKTFADVEADKLAAAEKTKAAEAKRVADEEARNRQKALDALTEENTRSQIQAREAEQGRAAAAEGRAAAQAEATTKKSALEEAKAAREAAMDALRARARAGVALPTLIGAAASDDRLGDLDDDAVAGVLAEEQAKAKQQDATTLKTLEQAKPKPKGRGLSAEEKARQQAMAAAKLAKAQADAERARADAEKAKNDLANPKSPKVDAATEKKRQQVLEVDNYVENIKRNIRDVKAQIEKTGTFELVGPEGLVMKRKLNEIATDMAKLADPGSVAREGEVALQASTLLPQGDLGKIIMRPATAQQVLDALNDDIEARRVTAYKIRGLDLPASAEADALFAD